MFFNILFIFLVYSNTVLCMDNPPQKTLIECVFGRQLPSELLNVIARYAPDCWYENEQMFFSYDNSLTNDKDLTLGCDDELKVYSFLTHKIKEKIGTDFSISTLSYSQKKEQIAIGCNNHKKNEKLVCIYDVGVENIVGTFWLPRMESFGLRWEFKSNGFIIEGITKNLNKINPVSDFLRYSNTIKPHKLMLDQLFLKIIIEIFVSYKHKVQFYRDEFLLEAIATKFSLSIEELTQIWNSLPKNIQKNWLFEVFLATRNK